MSTQTKLVPYFHPVLGKVEAEQCTTCNQWYYPGCGSGSSSDYTRRYDIPTPFMCVSCQAKQEFRNRVAQLAENLQAETEFSTVSGENYGNVTSS